MSCPCTTSALSVLALASICCPALTQAAEPLVEIPIDAPQDWRKERFALPPSFAPDMKLKGMEELRFSPGMFRPESEDFFSYVMVFRLEGQRDLTPDLLQQELLAYYRGLAKAVGRGRIKTDGFSIEVSQAETPQAEAVKAFAATLQWIEPFATKKPQTLSMDVRVWGDPKSPRTWAFLAVSPKDAQAPVWKQLHEIRDRFVKSKSTGGGP